MVGQHHYCSVVLCIASEAISPSLNDDDDDEVEPCLVTVLFTHQQLLHLLVILLEVVVVSRRPHAREKEGGKCEHVGGDLRR